ncbi:TetR-like C-terminal domain-containing protein [Rhodococcus sp. NPDC059968]|uniref:TetR-like C-terminal domain-containing protein n=1 Tax=Rhodococcus sp. NPDC059968 TaxID=3347017 RepID=UPI003670997D
MKELLSEGRDTVSIRDVALRSGVHEVTIYRRWGTPESLVLDVAVTQLNEESPLPDTGNLRTDLINWAKSVESMLQTNEGFAFFNAVSAARRSVHRKAEENAAPTVAASEYLKERADRIRDVLTRAAERGDAPPTVDTVLDVVLAPIYLRAIFGYRQGESDLSILVDRALQLGEFGR